MLGCWLLGYEQFYQWRVCWLCNWCFGTVIWSSFICYIVGAFFDVVLWFGGVLGVIFFPLVFFTLFDVLPSLLVWVLGDIHRYVLGPFNLCITFLKINKFLLQEIKKIDEKHVSRQSPNYQLFFCLTFDWVIELLMNGATSFLIVISQEDKIKCSSSS